jgi:hypothetical protein
MFYNGEFVGNFHDIIHGDITEVKSLSELESLINKLTHTMRVFQEHDGPELLKIAYQERLEEVIAYYMKMGGNV